MAQIQFCRLKEQATPATCEFLAKSGDVFICGAAFAQGFGCCFTLPVAIMTGSEPQQEAAPAPEVSIAAGGPVGESDPNALQD